MANTITMKHTASPKKDSEIRRRTEWTSLVKFPFQPPRHLKSTETYFGVEKNVRQRCIFCAKTDIALAGEYFRVSRLKGIGHFWNDNVKAIVGFDAVWWFRRATRRGNLNTAASSSLLPTKGSVRVFKIIGYGWRCSVQIVSSFNFKRQIWFPTALNQKIVNNYSGQPLLKMILNSRCVCVCSQSFVM